jgi:hypothetical protein
MIAIGGADTVLGQELHRLIADFSATRTMPQFDSPLNAGKDYLKGVPIKNLHASKPGTGIIQQHATDFKMEQTAIRTGIELTVAQIKVQLNYVYMHKD